MVTVSIAFSHLLKAIHAWLAMASLTLRFVDWQLQ